MTSFAAGCGFFTCEERHAEHGVGGGGGGYQGWEGRDYTRCLFNLRGFRVLCLGFCCVALINSKSVLRVLPKRTNMRTRTRLICVLLLGGLGVSHTHTHIRLTCPTACPPACLLSLAAGCTFLNYEKFLLRQHSADIYQSQEKLLTVAQNRRQLRNATWFVTEFIVILWIWYQ